MTRSNLTISVVQASDDDADELSQLIEMASGLAARCFELADSVTVRKVRDLESDEEWTELRVHVLGDSASVQESYRQYTEEWLQSVPTEKALQIRLALRLS